jgi:hypothetical protein
MTDVKGKTQYAKPLPDYGFVVPYEPPAGKPLAVICDIDGTLMKMSPERTFTEYDKVHLDEPDMRVARVLEQLASVGTRLLFVSGRPKACRESTRDSIADALMAVSGEDIVRFSLLMRPDYLSSGKPDYRPDYVVKYEIFDREIRDHYDVMAAIDDRLQVVHLWRALGILTLDVAGGDF